MMKAFISNIVCLVLASVISVSADISKQSPKVIQQFTSSYEVNALCVLTNAVRVDPKRYLQKYGDAKTRSSCASAANGPRQLLFMHTDLCRAARFHAGEMAKFNKLSHNTLGNVPNKSFSARMKRFFKESPALAENIARGQSYKSPIRLSNAWIASPGHCKNVMADKYNAIGLGFAAKRDFFGAQSFAGIRNRAIPQRIACGSHIVDKGKVYFLLAVKSGGPAPFVVVNGRRVQMKVEMRNPKAAIFRAEGSQCGVVPGKCNSYFFQYGKEKYPARFQLQTQGFGRCAPKQ